MEMSIRITNSSRKIVARVDGLELASLNGIRQGLFVTGKFLTKTTKKNISRSKKTGIYYKYKGRNKRASAEGEFPANRSGANRKSIQFLVKGKRKMIFGADMPYSKYLENGTKNMKSRNFLLRTIKETTGTQNKLLHNQMRRFIENAHR